jgi:predicted sulfurtransferase
MKMNFSKRHGKYCITQQGKSRGAKATVVARRDFAYDYFVYCYYHLGNPQLFRDHIFLHWSAIGVYGRIYVAHEGINAQISVPTENLDLFKQALNDIVFLRGIRLNYAIEDNGKSFFKLAIKVRPKLVADGLMISRLM